MFLISLEASRGGVAEYARGELYMAEGRGLYEVARERMRTRHLTYRTEQAYLQWIRRYVGFHKPRHPRDMGAAEVEAFLSHLAVNQHVSASTQNQALQALIFLYRQVLEIELPGSETLRALAGPSGCRSC
jgi:site-specific recombinase XerD